MVTCHGENMAQQLRRKFLSAKRCQDPFWGQGIILDLQWMPKLWRAQQLTLILSLPVHAPIHRFNAFSILGKRWPHTVAIPFAA